jgi:YggT family protein
LLTLSSLVGILFQAYYFVVLVRVVMSWITPSADSPFMRTFGPVIYGLTEPVLRPIRTALQPYQGRAGIDFSPLLLMLALGMVEGVMRRLLGGL